MHLIEIIELCLPIPLFLCLLISIASLFISLQNDINKIHRDLFLSPVIAAVGIVLTLLVLTVPGVSAQILGILLGGFVVIFAISLWVTFYLSVNQ